MTIDKELKNRLLNIRLIVTDFDGVMTDNTVYVFQDGSEMVRCSRADGWAVRKFIEMDIMMLCISTETNPVVQRRCDKIKIPCFSGKIDKLECLKKYLKDNGFNSNECLYVGNDTNDYECLEYAGIAVVPADAAKEVLHLADIRTDASGGQGVLREIFSIMIDARNSSKKG